MQGCSKVVSCSQTTFSSFIFGCPNTKEEIVVWLCETSSKVFTTGQARCNPEHALCIQMCGQFSNAHMAFYFLLCTILCLWNLEITSALCLLLNVLHNRIPCVALHKIFCVCGQQIIFHLIICFFYLLYHNVTGWKSPKITLVFLFITLFL